MGLNPWAKRVIVCGGREYNNYRELCDVLDAYHDAHGIKHLFHGNARGADKLAGMWGERTSGVNVHAVPAEWSKYGRRAGPIRNQNMLGQGIDLVIAFPGGAGTRDMVKRAEKAGVEVVRAIDWAMGARA